MARRLLVIKVVGVFPPKNMHLHPTIFFNLSSFEWWTNHSECPVNPEGYRLVFFMSDFFITFFLGWQSYTGYKKVKINQRLLTIFEVPSSTWLHVYVGHVMNYIYFFSLFKIFFNFKLSMCFVYSIY